MPTCKNGKGSYKGTEPSPKGLGFCARHEKIGTRKRGKDKKMWIVRSVKYKSGKRIRRWSRVPRKTTSKKAVKKSRKRKANNVTGGGLLKLIARKRQESKTRKATKKDTDNRMAKKDPHFYNDELKELLKKGTKKSKKK